MTVGKERCSETEMADHAVSLYRFDTAADRARAHEVARIIFQRISKGHFTVTDAMVSAAFCSRARDDEGEFECLGDLIGFSGENKTRTIIKAALEAALSANGGQI